MLLNQIIQKRFSKRDFNLYNREGVRLDCALVVKEYESIKNFLTHHCSVGEVIGIKATKDYRYLLTILASLETGITYIPMMVDYPQNRVEQIKEDSNFKLLITDELLNEMVNSSYPSKKVTELSPLLNAYVLFTSGTTGKPKGVMIPRKALENFISWVGEEFAHIDSEQHMLQLTEFTFDICLTDVGLFLQRNVHTHFSNFKSDFFRLAFEVQSKKISVLSTVPNNLSMLLSDVMKDKVNLSQLKTLLIAGARFSHGLYEKCKSRLGTNINLHNLYGPTECTVYSHQKKMSFREDQDCSGLNISIGKTLPNVTSIIFKDGKLMGPTEQGELLLGGVQLLEGYMNDPEKTKMVMLNFEGKDYYRTGDIAFCDEKGDYYVVGRMDDTIKVRGFRLNLLDIDAYIHRLSYIDDCATIAIPHPVAENQMIAIMRLKEPKTVKEIKKDLLEYLLDYQIPEKIIFVDSYPTNSSGKIDKKALKEKYLSQHQE